MRAVSQTAQNSSVSVLHVDDEPGFGDLVKIHLERDRSGDDRLDCDVTTVTRPADALSLLRADDTDFDCLVSDYSMPKMDGIELSAAVHETHPNLSILLFSGERTADVAAEIVEAGLTDYLRKGVGSDQYTKLVRRVEHAARSSGEFEHESDTSVDAVAVVGADDTFERVTPEYAQIYGYDTESLTGRHWTDLHPEREIHHIRSNVLPVVADGGEWSGRSTGLRRDGSTFTESKLVTALDGDRLLIAVSEVELDGR